MNEELLKAIRMRQLLQSQMDETVEEADEEGKEEELYISSFKEAYELLQLYRTPAGARKRQRLVQYVTDNRLQDNCDLIHNFLMELFRVGDYQQAIPVCDMALAFAPHNRDILGDAIHACGECGQFQVGLQYLEIAKKIPTDYWSCRLFIYAIDFLKTMVEAEPTDRGLFEQAMGLAEEFIRVFPFDEHGYNQKAELLVTMNRRQEAIQALEEAIYSTSPDQNDRRASLICAQCCVTLLNLLDDSSDYDRIIEIAETGMKHTTQEQPSASIGFFMYRKALALDAKAHCDNFRKETVNSALRFYQAAYDLNQGRGYARTIEQRYAVLRPHAESFTPLMKRPFFVEEQTEE